MVRRAAIEAAEPASADSAQAVPFRRRYDPDRTRPILATALGPAFLFVYLLSIFLPGTFSIGPLRFTLFKLILLLAFVPLALRWITGHSGRITMPDLLFLAFCVWVAIATLAVHGTRQIFYVGSTFVEYFGAYLAGRVIIRNADDYERFFRYFLTILLAMLPFAVFEAVTRIRLISNIMGLVLNTAGQYRFENAPRFGLTRVTGGFSHPILFGVVMGLGFANAYYIYKDRFLRQIRAVALVGVMTFLSISSGPLLALGLQVVMIGWDRILRVIRARWILGAVVGAITLVVLQVTLPGGIAGYIVDEVIFNPYGGHTRLTAFQYGSAEVLRNPAFGIGLGEWRRPFWEHESVDNFWLVVAMRHGLPAFGLLVLAIAVNALFVMTADLDERESRFRSGYLIALAALVLALATVHIWAGALVFVMTYLGIGVWFYARDPDDAPRRLPRAGRRQESERAAAARPSRFRPPPGAPVAAGGGGPTRRSGSDWGRGRAGPPPPVRPGRPAPPPRQAGLPRRGR
jgi:hypothetical protein